MQLVIEDPLEFLEYIPWEELKFIGSKNYDKIALWHPSKAIPAFDYHLFTDEEVYRYRVINDFAFAGLFQDGHLAFTITDIDATDFVEDMQEYWEKWVRTSSSNLRLQLMRGRERLRSDPTSGDA